MSAMITHDSEQHNERSTSEPFVSRVVVRNYKSIGRCRVNLSGLTVLVGKNGAGKSNFLDALRFVADGLQTSLDHAIKWRGGIDAVRRRSTGHPRNFAIELKLSLRRGLIAHFGFEIGARGQGGFVVRKEDLRIRNGAGDALAHYSIRDGQLASVHDAKLPEPSDDRLYLVAASHAPAFRAVYDALSSMGFYNLNPDAMKELQSPDAGELLHRDGANIASVVSRIGTDQPALLERIKQFLGTIVEGISEVERVALGPRETLEFRQAVQGARHPWKFYAASMSDGTLRALGALVAVAQLTNRESRISLVGIEEPETALHPTAAHALVDAIREASASTQVVVTTHSPELIDWVDLERELRVVRARAGATEISPPNEASREAIRQHLYSPGELLRMDQLEPDEKDISAQSDLDDELPLFS